jgi:hypothetical protein
LFLVSNGYYIISRKIMSEYEKDEIMYLEE